MFLPSKGLLWIAYTSPVSIGLLAIILTELLEFFTYSWYKYCVGSTHCKYFIVPQFTVWLFTMFIESFIFDRTNFSYLALSPFMRAKLLQWCPTLRSMNCSPSGSSVHEILQARILEWVSTPFSRGSSQPRDPTHVSYISCLGRQVLYH